MGFSKKHQAVDIGLETEGHKKKWVIAGIAVRGPMKPIKMKPKEMESGYDSDESRSTTPTAREARIPERLLCPPAPQKRRPSSTCHFNGAREFFNPPDLESVFIRHAERAN